MKKLGLFASLTALCYISGAYLALVQTLAWSQMLVVYSQQSDLRTGFSQTFDGKHPCALCKEVQKKSQQDPLPSQPLKLSDLKSASLSFDRPSPPFLAQGVTEYSIKIEPFLGIDSDTPPLPPPRA